MIGALVALLSLDMSRKLIAAGTVATTLAIAAASNATPIVVQTTAAHGLVRPAHGVVSGVGGNAGANGLWVLTPTDATHLALSTFDPNGVAVNSVGSGTYTSGGTIQIAFPDGSILLGRRNVAMQTAVATPRIVFVPIGSPQWDLEPYGGAIPPTSIPRTRASQTTEQLLMKQARQLATEPQRFEVHVTGCASPPSPDFGDFDVTQAIYGLLYGSLFDLITPPRLNIVSGTWVSQARDIQTLDTRGQKWVGVVEISQPVLDQLLTFVPVNTGGELIVNFTDGASADQTVILVP